MRRPSRTSNERRASSILRKKRSGSFWTVWVEKTALLSYAVAKAYRKAYPQSSVAAQYCAIDQRPLWGSCTAAVDDRATAALGRFCQTEMLQLQNLVWQLTVNMGSNPSFKILTKCLLLDYPASHHSNPISSDHSPQQTAQCVRLHQYP